MIYVKLFFMLTLNIVFSSYQLSSSGSIQAETIFTSWRLSNSLLSYYGYVTFFLRLDNLCNFCSSVVNTILFALLSPFLSACNPSVSLLSGCSLAFNALLFTFSIKVVQYSTDCARCNHSCCVIDQIVLGGFQVWMLFFFNPFPSRDKKCSL